MMNTRNVNVEKKSRKSAPVKNAVFVGAMHKDRGRIHPFSAKDSSSVNGQTETRKSRPSEFNKSKHTPVRMSTPVRNVKTSPRYCTRNRSKETVHNRSRSILSSVGGRRRYHPDYDPYIEIRRAQERLSRYRTQGDWKIDLLLGDDADEDLHRYEEKLKRRLSLKGDLPEPIELERRQLELLRRQRDIDMGKVTDRYAEYVLSIPKPERERYHPRTPNKFRKVSRRAWDGMIHKWRKHLHNFDDLNFEESWRSLSTADYSMRSNVSSQISLVDSASDTENVNPSNRLSTCSYSLQCEFKNSKALTTSPTLKMSLNCEQKIYRVQNEDEDDTLQDRPKLFRGNKTPNLLNGDDEDTMHETRRITRSSSGNRTNHALSADVLHSGLTNDMQSFASTGQKRTKTAVGDIKNLSDFPVLNSTSKLTHNNPVEMASPSKKAKRGILLQNGISAN